MTDPSGAISSRSKIVAIVPGSNCRALCKARLEQWLASTMRLEEARDEFEQVFAEISRGALDIFKALDKAYVIVLSRYRRQLGDVQFESACRRARDTIYFYLAFLGAAIVCGFMLIVAAYSGAGSSLLERELGVMQLFMALAFLGAMLFLNRRFSGFTPSSAMLTREETIEDRRFLFYFRLISIGSFVLVCIVGVTLHELGF
jgi:hypothetical protein